MREIALTSSTHVVGIQRSTQNKVLKKEHLSTKLSIQLIEYRLLLTTIAMQLIHHLHQEWLKDDFGKFKYFRENLISIVIGALFSVISFTPTSCNVRKLSKLKVIIYALCCVASGFAPTWLV
uniref:Uncharacterized protein n=1 Tax=Glossina austeni TaxID=7395 RepID=A0A1A9VL93_GLOAU